ncbi:hypothetical protein [Yersinia frederiksenii]|uniref:hypothetical protein n=1 Tax=Yersinia frederiksenii TaxID=29484 RepID=UPI0005E79DF0|nr:hypothetical protein [Yersinia frederiksenii]CQH62161.1 Uncharacterised protein [Yersinia frederiksenii]
MTITYKDISERQKQLNIARESRIEIVVTEAVALVEAYQKSLVLDKSTWKDIEGKEQPYVMAGVLDKEGNFIKKPLTSIELGADYVLSFEVATVVDDSPRGGDMITQSICISIDGGVAKVNLQDVGKIISVIDGDRTGICDAMKDRVLMSIYDDGLEEKRYF